MKSRIFAVLVSVFSVVIIAGSVPTSSSAQKQANGPENGRPTGENARAMVRFLKAEHARGRLFGAGFTVKEIRCRSA